MLALASAVVLQSAKSSRCVASSLPSSDGASCSPSSVSIRTGLHRQAWKENTPSSVEHPVICRTPHHRRGSQSSLCHRNRPCARAPVVERIMAGHIRSLFLNGEWQYISARGQCDMRATRNTMPSHSSSHSRAPRASHQADITAVSRYLSGHSADQRRTTGASLRTWRFRG